MCVSQELSGEEILRGGVQATGRMDGEGWMESAEANPCLRSTKDLI